MAKQGEALIERIIREQELIIGPLAWREANKVKGLSAAKEGGITVNGKMKDVLSGLVAQYEELFGPASREVCREAAARLLPGMPAADVPDVLK